jgi:serine/threonine-protein kinase
VLGQQFGHYRILEKIGAGGMGEVYRAHDEQLDRDVALKVLPAQTLTDETARARLLREARSAAALNHPHICTVYEVGEAGGQAYIAMELVEGKPLSELVPEQGLPAETVLRFGSQIADALAHAHDHRIVHRDLKNANVVITPEGRAKVLDFGLAKRLSGEELAEAATKSLASLTEAGALVGTVPYMVPEQLRGQPADARSDVWALGIVFYEMAAGRRPFQGQTGFELSSAILNQVPPPLPPAVPAELRTVIERCLAKEPGQRYQRGSEVRAALEAVQSGTALPAWPAWRYALSRRRWLVLTVALAFSVVVAILVALNVGGLRERLGGGAPRIQSLAVLPVKNDSGDPGQEFFADGMTDGLIAGLAQIKAIKVISRTSVMQYKEAKKSLRQIANELDVEGIVEASVIRSGGRVRVTAQLVDARRDQNLWASNYERNTMDVLVVQSEVVQAIAGEIRAAVTPQESERLKAARQVDPEVYDTTLKAGAILEYAMREEQFRQAIELFQKAIDRDPTYAPAWAGLGEALWSLTTAGGNEFVAPAEVRDMAIAAADRALKLDPNLADAHKARAVIASDGEWDLVKAQQEFEKALELRPGYAAAENLYGQIFLFTLLRFDEARRHFDRARELDPFSPWNDHNAVAWWLYQGRFEKTLEEAERVMQRNPTLWIVRQQMGGARLMLGQPGQAAAEFEAAIRLARPEPPPPVAFAALGLAYGLAGRRADALKVLAEMEQASKNRHISPYCLALVYSGLGRMDEAFRLLDQALEQRTPYLTISSRYDPGSVGFRRDPRWKPFMERVRREMRLPPGTPNPYL